MYSNLNVKSLSIVADSVRYCDKHHMRFVVGMFERQQFLSYDTSFQGLLRQFPALDDPRFKLKVNAAAQLYLTQCEEQQFTGITDKIGFNTLVSADVAFKELCNQREFIETGEAERHCVGGYFGSC